MPARQLSVVPETPPRALGLIRVSKERDEMISPELQRTAIEDHCARRGYQLIECREGLDESGSSRRSKWWAKLDEAVATVEAGDTDVLVVWRFSRAARQRLKWAVAIDRVETAGGLLESATEPLDTSTASGRLARGMLAEFAAYEAEAIGNTWREAHARRTKQGLPANGKPRFGYRYLDGLHRPDPDTGPVLAELYRRYIAGESTYSLVVWLNGQGVRTVPGYSAKGPGPWSINGLRGTLDAGFGAGFITVHGSRQRGIHEPVITPDTWTAYLAARERRRPLRRAERSPYLLSSMVWCGCGSKMGFGSWGRTPRAGARCLASTQPGAQRHPGSYAKLEPIEAAVIAWLRTQAGPVDESADAELARHAHTARRRQDAKTLARQVLELDQALGRLTVSHAKGLVPDAAYEHAAAELATERAQLEARRLMAEAESGQQPAQLLAADLVEHWDLYDVEHRRGVLRQLITRVTVTWWERPARVVITDWAGCDHAT